MDGVCLESVPRGIRRGPRADGRFERGFRSRGSSFISIYQHRGCNGLSPTQETDLQKTVDNTVNGVVKGGEGSNNQKLRDLDQPQEKTAYVAQFLLDELGDQQSEKFYRLVAAKIPEAVIREALSAIRVDGAESPAKLFTFKMQRYALGKSGLDSQTKTFEATGKRGKGSTYTEPAMIRNYPEHRGLRK